LTNKKKKAKRVQEKGREREKNDNKEKETFCFLAQINALKDRKRRPRHTILHDTTLVKDFFLSYDAITYLNDILV